MRNRNRAPFYYFEVVCWLDNRSQVFTTRDVPNQTTAVFDGQSLIAWVIDRHALITRAEVKTAFRNGV